MVDSSHECDSNIMDEHVYHTTLKQEKKKPENVAIMVSLIYHYYQTDTAWTGIDSSMHVGPTRFKCTFIRRHAKIGGETQHFLPQRKKS